MLPNAMTYQGPIPLAQLQLLMGDSGNGHILYQHSCTQGSHMHPSLLWCTLPHDHTMSMALSQKVKCLKLTRISFEMKVYSASSTATIHIFRRVYGQPRSIGNTSWKISLQSLIILSRTPLNSMLSNFSRPLSSSPWPDWCTQDLLAPGLWIYCQCPQCLCWWNFGISDPMWSSTWWPTGHLCFFGIPFLQGGFLSQFWPVLPFHQRKSRMVGWCCFQSWGCHDF